MHPFDALRFLEQRNPLGFSAADFLELGFAGAVVLLLFASAWLEPAARRLASKTAPCMLLLFSLVVALRLALLPLHPVPAPSGSDDFSYLLLGDTLAHFRLANPPHALHRFFETTFVLQEPSYSSIYQAGQGIVLALGQIIFGLPWAGVLLSTAALSALCYWMLRGWTSPGWALIGGLLGVCQFGPLNMWMNCYWGGAVSGIAGCLVFGALPRLRERWRARDAVLLGVGIGLQILSRPYESLFLDVAVVMYLAPELRWGKQWPRLARAALIAFIALAPAALLQLFQDRAVTGSWTTIPYQVSRYQYGVPTTFTFQPNPIPHAKLTAAQEIYYEGQAAAHGPVDTPARYLARLAGRVPFYAFFFMPPLWIALPFYIPLLRQFRYAWVAGTIVLFALGCNFYPYFFPHYIAALTCVFLLVTVAALARLSAITVRGRVVGEQAARWILVLCGALFLFWYGVNAFGSESILRAAAPYATGVAINYDDPQGRIAVNKLLAAAPGKQLVFVRYFATHGYDEWIHNAADIDRARVVWALDLGPEEDARLEAYYPDRKVWLLEPDAQRPLLIPYQGGH